MVLILSYIKQNCEPVNYLYLVKIYSITQFNFNFLENVSLCTFQARIQLLLLTRHIAIAMSTNIVYLQLKC